MIILDEFIDLMKVIRIKIVAFYAEMPFNRFGKELCFVGVGLGDFVHVALWAYSRSMGFGRVLFR